MGTSAFQLEFYVLAKFIAYTAWCAVGIQQLWRAERAASVALASAAGTGVGRQVFLASAYGLLRLFMGVFFGILIWIAGTMVAASMFDAPHRDVLVYLAVYVPVRWVEWTILAWLMARSSGTRLGYTWRFGGIAISCLADIPLIASTGWTLPLGRFFC